MRSRGEGTITKRKDGRYAVAVSLPDGRRQWFYAHTHREAAAKLAGAREQVRRFGRVSADARSLERYLVDWLARVRPDLAPQSVRRYEMDIRIHIVPAIGRTRLASLSAADLATFYAGLTAAGLAPNRVRGIHMLLRGALGAAVRLELLPRNVTDLVKPPSVPRTVRGSLTPEDAERILAAAAGDPLEALFVLALSTGMRQGELLGLTWPNVDLDAGQLTVAGTLTHAPRRPLEVRATKTAAGARPVVLAPFAADALRQHRARQVLLRVAAAAWDDRAFVFCGPRGQPLHPQRIGDAFRRLLGRAALPPMRFHDLRHGAATLLLSRGVHPRIVADLLGHSSPALTLAVYSHVTPRLQAEAAAAMQALFGRPS